MCCVPSMELRRWVRSTLYRMTTLYDRFRRTTKWQGARLATRLRAATSEKRTLWEANRFVISRVPVLERLGCTRCPVHPQSGSYAILGGIQFEVRSFA